MLVPLCPFLGYGPGENHALVFVFLIKHKNKNKNKIYTQLEESKGMKLKWYVTIVIIITSKILKVQEISGKKHENHPYLHHSVATKVFPNLSYLKTKQKTVE